MNPQLKKGVLELCVLSQLTKEDKYGYELTDAISREMSIAAGTLYMILKQGSRLRGNVSTGIRIRPCPEILPSD
jgi:DNA-binding PadR family transcriptional regulator